MACTGSGGLKYPETVLEEPHEICIKRMNRQPVKKDKR